MLDAYQTSIWVLCAFFTLFGVILLTMSRNVGRPEDTSFLKARIFLFLFALLYFSLAHYAAYSAIVYSVEYGTQPACTNLINTTSTNLSTNLTSYTYVSSCSTTPPAAQNAFQVGLGYVLWIELVILLLGSLYLIIDRAARRW